MQKHHDAALAVGHVVDGLKAGKGAVGDAQRFTGFKIKSKKKSMSSRYEIKKTSSLKV